MLPKDPVMLLSFVNTKLRDECPSLEEFAYDYGIRPEEIRASLRAIDYEYDEDLNKFI
ncbi:MAG: DUF4250 domain-containing protein [Clostridiales bacterium]|nr:DUF4250 domain-containing protein [Clostridiales bacterium]MCD8214910.1 DUF4250 domain-containing protein [Clostridiales bacterium]